MEGPCCFPEGLHDCKPALHHLSVIGFSTASPVFGGVIIFVFITLLRCVVIAHSGFNLHFSRGDASDVEYLFMWYLPPVSSSVKCWFVIFNHQCSLCASGGSSN